MNRRRERFSTIFVLAVLVGRGSDDAADGGPGDGDPGDGDPGDGDGDPGEACHDDLIR